ncbi:Uncharacterised protein g9633 [Pycnogonum litorale]
MVLLRILVALIVVTQILTAGSYCPSAFIATIGQVYGAPCVTCLESLDDDIYAELDGRNIETECQKETYPSKCLVKKMEKLKDKSVVSICFYGTTKRCKSSTIG